MASEDAVCRYGNGEEKRPGNARGKRLARWGMNMAFLHAKRVPGRSVMPP
jgi:hypothetical protein